MQHGFMKMPWPAVASILALAGATTARAEGWGNIRGQVVWDAGAAPLQVQINVDKDREACLKKGQLFDERLVVNPRNKGVRWCLVYLMSTDGFTKDIPINPKLKEVKRQTVELDQPCCQFEPHMLTMREGQTLLVKNSAGIAHNVNITGAIKGPNLNQIVPAGGQFKVERIVSRNLPIIVKCDIHGWMNGWIAVLKNPYFAITDEDGKFEIKDAPAGDFRLVI
jgi:hypothetical protein